MPNLVEEREERRRTHDWNIGTNIRYRRIRLDIEQKALAELADMDVTQLSRIESGKRTLRFHEGLAIAKALGIRPEELTRKVTNGRPLG